MNNPADLQSQFLPATFQPKAGSGSWQPRQVLLFSGHMFDKPDCTSPRFPAAKEAIAAQQIAATLAQLKSDHHDLALTQGASGGDILFAEACLQLGVKLQLLQPFAEPLFIENSVITAGGDWFNRYMTIKNGLESPPLAATTELGEQPAHMNAYERCNLWLLSSALAYGPEKLTFICLWNGDDSHAPGGTGHMVAEVKKQNSQVIWLDTRNL